MQLKPLLEHSKLRWTEKVMETTPRFPDKRDLLLKILTETRLAAIWQDKVRAETRKQCLLDLSDYQDIHSNLSTHIQRLRREIQQGAYKPRDHVRVLSEKSKGLCRQLVVLDALDALILQTIVNEMLPALEKNKPSKRSYYRPESHRFAQKVGYSGEYGARKTWLRFQKQVLGFALTKPYLVVTDVANFFDGIELDEIRNMYLSFDNMNEQVIEFMFYIIEYLKWRPDYVPQTLRGIPQMNLDAPRVLANSFLFDIDRFLERIVPDRFVRYMDDIDIGVENIGEAKLALRDVDIVLHTRGLRLNSGKTQIMRGEDALKYYFARDNLHLDTLSSAIDRKESAAKKNKTPLNLNRETAYSIKKFKRLWGRKNYFTKGQGEKVLKRFIGLSIKLNFQLPQKAMSAFLMRHPALRELTLKAMAFYGYTRSRLLLVRDYILGDMCIDDESLFLAAKCIVDLNCPNTKFIRELTNDISRKIVKRGRVGFVATTWLMSKYGSELQLLRILRDEFHTWAGDPWVGRQVGALYPRFISRKTSKESFLSLVRNSRNAGAQEVYKYNSEILSSLSASTKLYRYLQAKNPSLPRQMMHQKVLLFITFMHSGAAVAQKTALKKHFSAFHLDGIEKALLRGLI